MTSARHQLIADAALEVLAQQGSRGLTHRAVDAAADLPSGSTSYYYRSRAALLSACVWRLIERDYAEFERLPPLTLTAGPDEIAEILAGLLHRWITADRLRHLARYELSLEAVRRPELGAELHRAGRELRERVSAALAGFGVAAPERHARWLVACLDGILFDNIAGANASDPTDLAEVRAMVRVLVGAVLAK